MSKQDEGFFGFWYRSMALHCIAQVFSALCIAVGLGSINFSNKHYCKG